MEKIKTEILKINPHMEIRTSSYFKGMLEILGQDLAQGRFLLEESRWHSNATGKRVIDRRKKDDMLFFPR